MDEENRCIRYMSKHLARIEGRQVFSLIMSILMVHPARIPVSKLHIIIHQPDFLSRLEGWQSNVRTPVTPERVSQRAVATAPDLALHREVDLIQVVR